ncbi:MAG: hypothetical protein MH472_05965 [Bacteroidia bacterium]|nr:hypothetical protein [Bacteroidia bacterium]
MLLTVSGLAKVAIFTTNVDAENQTLINHKCVCGALNRHFCQTRVSTSPFFSVVVVHYHFVSVLMRWLGGSFAKFSFGVGLCDFANVPPKALANSDYFLFSLSNSKPQQNNKVDVYCLYVPTILLFLVQEISQMMLYLFLSFYFQV